MGGWHACGSKEKTSAVRVFALLFVAFLGQVFVIRRPALGHFGFFVCFS